MERLTRPNLNVDETAAKFMGEEVNLKDMPDRLLDLVLNGPTLNAVNKDVLRQFIRQLYGALKVCEDMEEQGRLVVLPCKVGDLLYEIDLPEYGVIVCKVLHIITAPDFVTKEPVTVVEVEVIDGHGVGSCYDFEIADFGKTVFKSREQAVDAWNRRVKPVEIDQFNRVENDAVKGEGEKG